MHVPYGQYINNLCSRSKRNIQSICGGNFRNIEVRDSRTGYLVPGRDGLGVWPDGKIVCTSSSPPPVTSGNSGWHSGQETILGVFKLDFDSYERYQDFETGTQNFEPDLCSIAIWPGEPFWKTIPNVAIWVSFTKITHIFFEKKTTQKWFRRRKLWRSLGVRWGEPPPCGKSQFCLLYTSPSPRD